MSEMSGEAAERNMERQPSNIYCFVGSIKETNGSGRSARKVMDRSLWCRRKFGK